MSDLIHNHETGDTTGGDHKHGNKTLFKIDRVWLAIIAVVVAVFVLDTANTYDVVSTAARALLTTLPFILFAVLAIGWLKATGAETVLSKAFEGKETRMIVLAAFAGGLSPFCSCEVIPFIAAMLAAGAPLSAVMAFWLASPLMDPAIFAITAGALGSDMALAKAVSAISIALIAGFAMMALMRGGAFADPLRSAPAKASCCGSTAPKEEKPYWRFWQVAARRALFSDAALSNLFFLFKWMTFAYLLEALMLRYVPAELIAGLVGGEGLLPVVTAALVGAPAYLNGYAAPALVAGLIEQGMSNGAGLAFMIAGGATCIPAAVAVWALVKPQVFAAYIGFSFFGAVGAGLVLNAL